LVNFGVGGFELPRLELDLARNSAPQELSLDPAERFITIGEITGRFPTTSPEELVDIVIGVAWLALLPVDIEAR